MKFCGECGRRTIMHFTSTVRQSSSGRSITVCDDIYHAVCSQCYFSPNDCRCLPVPEAPPAGYTASCGQKTLLSSSPVINNFPVEKSGAEGPK